MALTTPRDPAIAPPETWRPIACAPRYDISTLGRVRHGERLLRPRRAGDVPHLYIEFYKASVRGAAVARLVADAFLGPCPTGMRLVHLNGDGCDPAVTNLAYVPFSRYHLQRLFTVPVKRHVRHAPADAVPPTRVAYLAHGLPSRPDDCPRCGAPVAHEPAFVHCRVCGRLFPLQEGRLDAQAAFEAVSGLRSESVP
jgi:hypothetical protein